jgi:cytochrome c oxidase subunit 2
MYVETYERVWMWLAGGLIAVFLGVIVATAANGAIAPPSHLETVDPAALSTHPEFGSPTVRTNADGSVVVTVVASMFSFTAGSD